MSERDNLSVPSQEAFGAPAPLPAYRLDVAGLREPVTDLALLGLENAMQDSLVDAGIGTVSELHQMPDQQLRARVRGLGPKKIAEIRQKITDFSNDLAALQVEKFGEQPQPQGEIVINAIDWFDKHGLTWKGAPKTGLMTRIEGNTGNLGNFLYTGYIEEEVSQAEIIRRIQQASGGSITLGPDVARLLSSYNLGPDPQRAIEARRSVGTMSAEKQNELKAALETAPRVRINEERLNAARLLERATAENLRARNPGLLTDRDWLVFEQHVKGVSREAIAEKLGISDTRVSQLETRAF